MEWTMVIGPSTIPTRSLTASLPSSKSEISSSGPLTSSSQFQNSDNCSPTIASVELVMKTREPPLWRREPPGDENSRTSQFLATKFGCLQESHVFPHSDAVTCSPKLLRIFFLRHPDPSQYSSIWLKAVRDILVDSCIMQGWSMLSMLTMLSRPLERNKAWLGDNISTGKCEAWFNGYALLWAIS